MEDIKNFKEKLINDYIYKIEDINKVKVSELKEQLKNLLGEEPAIKFNYVENLQINEDSGKLKRLENELESVEIYYTYTNSDNHQYASHLKYIIN